MADIPKEVLVIGNGFDVALGLPTRYTDFMEFLRISNPVDMIERVKGGSKPEEKFEKFFLADPVDIGIEEIKQFVKLRDKNSWAQYYMKCNADIKGWIDLEREMLPVFDFFLWLFGQEKRMTGDGKGYKAQITAHDEDKYRMVRILPKFVSVGGSSGGAISTYTLSVNSDYCDAQYGIFKEKIIADLTKDLDDFIEMFRIYLREFISNAKRKPNRLIENLNADRIINFNYVQSEIFLENLTGAEVIHVHGDTTKSKNMVLGVNAVPNDKENDFLYFTKSFQRIKTKSNPHYRDFWEGPFNVTFFGHSLDITDIDILKPLYEKAERVTVFYYKEKDYQTKIQNLIRMVGIERIENDNYSGRLELISSEG